MGLSQRLRPRLRFGAEEEADSGRRISKPGESLSTANALAYPVTQCSDHCHE